MIQPLLTIITVTKNCSSTLGKTLQSVNDLKKEEIEYIVIDGASTDGTVDLLKNAGALVDYFLSEPDFGIYNAMNKGINLATGKYLLFINGDDELVPSGFSAIWPLLKSGKENIISANTKVALNFFDSKILQAKPWQILFFNSIPHPSTFVRTSLLKRYYFREDLLIAADYDLFLRLFLDGNRFAKVNVISAIHHPGGVSTNSRLSSDEMNRVRLERLGRAIFSLLNAIWATYRITKSFIYFLKNK